MQHIYILSSFQDTLVGTSLTPHSTALHVGLKSLALSRLSRHIGIIAHRELW
ncbi:hypothetical protein Barb6XT_02573 [Bacteroidales bacterium Barb6XT]|nr:hypothetical protein Barb6XT_02573 [Bacteroidales bacterium Barb6XT]